MRKTGLYCILLASVFLFTVNNSIATTISYTALNLTDAQPDEDLWQYSYTLSGSTFNRDYGFTIYFDENLYAELDNPLAGADWDPIFWQPDSSIPTSGAYDALALSDNSSLLEVFTIDYLWLGLGTPGSQLFEVYTFDSSGSVVILEEGRTIADQAAPIPEPSSVLLLGLGVAITAIVRKRLMNS